MTPSVTSTHRVEKRKPTTLRGQHTRAVLLQAAEEVFGRRGFSATGVGEITHRAGVATGTFYVHFHNKESVFLAVVEELGTRLEAFVAERAASHGQRLSRQRAVLKAFLEFVALNPHLYRMVRQSDSVDETVYRAYYQRIAKAFVAGLSDSMTQGEVSRFEPEVLAYILMGVAHFVGMRFVEWEADPRQDAILEEVVAFVEAGLRAPRKAPQRPGTKPAVAAGHGAGGYSFFR
jgi:AcrR family transcriptional regulator